MECHKCPFSAEIAAGRAESVEYEKSPCSTCSIDVGRGKIMVPYDDDLHTPELPASDELGTEVMPVSVLGDALRVLLTMPRENLEVVRLRFAGLAYGYIAEKLGLKSEGAAMTRMTRILDANPVLLSLFPRKAKARLVHKERLRALSRRAKRVSGGKGS